jgi:hypothetical protein
MTSYLIDPTVCLYVSPIGSVQFQCSVPEMRVQTFFG